MKALIRGTEIIKEPFSEWVKNNISFLTGTEVDEEGNPLKGDGWTLVEDYVEPEKTLEGDGHIPVTVKEEEPVVEEPDFIEVNGVRYYKR